MTFREAMLAARREYWLQLLDRTNWCISEAAEIAEVNRTAAYRMIAEAGIEPRKRVMQRDKVGSKRVQVFDMRGFFGAPSCRQQS